jgi:hypothetical protein
MFYNILTVVILQWTATNKYTKLRAKCVLLCQPVFVASAPFRDLPRKLPWDETFMLTEKKREATRLSSRGEKDSCTINTYLKGLITKKVRAKCVIAHVFTHKKMFT